MQRDSCTACATVRAAPDDYDRRRLDPFVAHYLVFDQAKIPIRSKDPMRAWRPGFRS
jgi:hypothetical protein